MAQKIEHEGDRIVFTFGAASPRARGQLDQNARLSSRSSRQRLAGRRITVTVG